MQSLMDLFILAFFDIVFVASSSFDDSTLDIGKLPASSSSMIHEPSESVSSFSSESVMTMCVSGSFISFFVGLSSLDFAATSFFF